MRKYLLPALALLFSAVPQTAHAVCEKLTKEEAKKASVLLKKQKDVGFFWLLEAAEAFKGDIYNIVEEYFDAVALGQDLEQLFSIWWKTMQPS